MSWVFTHCVQSLFHFLMSRDWKVKFCTGVKVSCLSGMSN